MAQEIRDLMERLNREDVVSEADFKRICARLVSDTVIMADDSQVEQELYDKALLVRSDIAEYLDVLQLKLVHNERLRYFRLYPPAATSPGATDRGDLHRSEASLYRRPLGPGVGVLLFILRLLYAQGLQEGKVEGGNAVMTDLAEVNIMLKNKTGRDPLPAQQRQAAFREIAGLWRAIRYNAKDKLDDPSTRILIRPIICDLISSERAQAALEVLRQDEAAVADAAEADAGTVDAPIKE